MGWAGQRHRLNAARLVLGRYRRPLATHWQKVNLLNAFGPFGGLLATYLLLLIALLLVIAWERHFFRRQAAVRTVKESA